MSKRAILQITPFSQEGRDRNLFLTLQEYQVTDGARWEWHLPQHFGWGPNDTGIFAKNLPDTTTVFCMDSAGSKDLMRIEGVVGRTLGEFPFTPTDLQNPLSGALVVIEDNYYLTAGSYTWAVYGVRI
jgi:hypothetical protein